MATEVEELLIKLRADISGLQASLNQARQETENAAGGMKSAFKEAGQAILGFFAFDKMIGLVKESVGEFAKMQRGINDVVRVMQALGIATAGSYREIETYIKDAKMASRFNEEGLAESLKILINATKDQTTAFKMNEMAMNLSVLTGKGVAESANTLALAYIGNQRGLMQLGKALKLTGADAKDAQKMFDLLNTKFKDLARGESDAAAQMDLNKKKIEEQKEALGEDLYPAVTRIESALIGFGQGVMNVGKSIGSFFGFIFSVISNGLDKIVEQSTHTASFLTNVWRHPIDATKKYAQQSYATFKGNKDQIIYEAKSFGKSLADIWSGPTEAAKKHYAGVVKVQKGVTKLTKEEMAEQKRIAHVIAKDMTKVWEDAAKKCAEAWKEGTLTIGMAFEILGKGIAKSLINALADALEEEAAKKLVEAMANSLDPLTMFAAPGEFAAAGLLAAGAGTMKGVAATFLAKGGIVDRPTLAVLGESGPEKVTPLDRGDTGGNIIHHTQIILPSVRDARGFARERATIEREMAMTSSNLKRRTGNRQGAL